MPLPTDDSARAVLRHLTATLAYRAAKVLRDVPSGFATFSSGLATRQPVQIVAHMADLMMWAQSLARGENVWKAGGSEAWDVEVQRFFGGLEALDAELTNAPPHDGAAEQLLQGPLADALTHVGQLAMLRNLAGTAVKPENYARAVVVAGKVGLDQAAPKREFDGDASARRK
jgi:hypothetical protein